MLFLLCPKMYRIPLILRIVAFSLSCPPAHAADCSLIRISFHPAWSIELPGLQRLGLVAELAPCRFLDRAQIRVVRLCSVGDCPFGELHRALIFPFPIVAMTVGE